MSTSDAARGVIVLLRLGGLRRRDVIGDRLQGDLVELVDGSRR